MANSYLSRTPSSTGNRRTFTFSTWLKRGSNFGSEMGIFTGGDDANATGFFTFYITTNDRIDAHFWNGSSFDSVAPNAVLRDPSAWYHLVCAVDTTQSTASDRIKIYINGELQTSMYSTDYPDLNHEFNVNHTSIMQVGVRRNGSGALAGYFDGYMSHAVLVDGAALTAASFGETESTSGIWKFKSPSGVTFGTNGFHLKFENSGALGTDSSGNSNTYTVNGDLKQALDTPSNSYTTLNPLNVPISNAPTFSFGNTKTITMNTDPGYFGGTSTFGASQGKWYTEIKITDNNSVGAVGITFNPGEVARQGTTFSAQIADSFIYANNGKQYSSATGTGGSSYGNTYTDADIIGIAMDLDNSKLYFHKNGTYENSGVPTSGSTGTGAISITADKTYFFYLTDVGGTTATYESNFGNGHFGTTAISSAGSNGNGSLFEYDVPSGYYALNTKNINTYG